MKRISYTEVANLRNQGLTLSEIGRLLGCSKQAVHYILKRGQADPAFSMRVNIKKSYYDPSAWQAWEPAKFYAWVQNLENRGVHPDKIDYLIEYYHKGLWVQRLKPGVEPQAYFSAILRHLEIRKHQYVHIKHRLLLETENCTQDEILDWLAERK